MSGSQFTPAATVWNESRPHRSVVQWIMSSPTIDWLVAAYQNTRFSRLAQITTLQGQRRGAPVQNGSGRLLDLVGSNAAIAGTVNKDGGQPVSSDDRVVLILGAASQGGGQD